VPVVISEFEVVAPAPPGPPPAGPPPAPPESTPPTSHDLEQVLRRRLEREMRVRAH
jgi:hypothetical protein